MTSTAADFLGAADAAMYLAKQTHSERPVLAAAPLARCLNTRRQAYRPLATRVVA